MGNFAENRFGDFASGAPVEQEFMSIERHVRVAAIGSEKEPVLEFVENFVVFIAGELYTG